MTNSPETAAIYEVSEKLNELDDIYHVLIEIRDLLRRLVS